MRRTVDMHKWLLLASPLFLLTAAACIVNTTGNNSCTADATVTGCSGMSQGYTCTGSETPPQVNANLVCGSGLADPSGNTQYCCNTSNGSCTVDTTLACSGATQGYTCSGTETPSMQNGSLACDAGMAEGNGATGYCCTTTSTTCNQDTSVQGCTNGSAGYTCAGADTPDSSTLSCSQGVAGPNGSTQFCCVGFSSSTCMADATVMGCTGSSYGFSCTGTDAPSQSDTSLTCSAGVAGQAGATLYCCVGFSSTSCMADSTVTGCTGSSYGFSCNGTETPSQVNSSLMCSQGVPGANGLTLYCCTG